MATRLWRQHWLGLPSRSRRSRRPRYRTDRSRPNHPRTWQRVSGSIRLPEPPAARRWSRAGSGLSCRSSPKTATRCRCRLRWTLRPDEGMYVQEVLVVAPANPNARMTRFRLSAASVPEASTRIRLAGTQDAIAALATPRCRTNSSPSNSMLHGAAQGFR